MESLHTDSQRKRAKVLVVEDESDLLAILKTSLEEAHYMVETASNLEDAMLSLNRLDFQCVISDVCLASHQLGGIEVLKKLQSTEIPVVLISGNANFEAMKQAINLGASFFIEKPFDLAKLHKALEGLIKNSESVEQKLLNLATSSNLTPRETEIVRYLSKGLSNREISQQTGTSERTVKAHLSSIFKKTRASSSSELLSRLIS